MTGEAVCFTMLHKIRNDSEWIQTVGVTRGENALEGCLGGVCHSGGGSLSRAILSMIAMRPLFQVSRLPSGHFENFETRVCFNNRQDRSVCIVRGYIARTLTRVSTKLVYYLGHWP